LIFLILLGVFALFLLAEWPGFFTTLILVQECGKEFPLAILKEVLRPRIMQKLMQRRQAEEVSAAGKVFFCHLT
jgi:hypothetical protein